MKIQGSKNHAPHFWDVTLLALNNLLLPVQDLIKLEFFTGLKIDNKD